MNYQNIGVALQYIILYLISESLFSVIILNDKIDEGPILYTKKYYDIEKNIDFDYVLDPLIRAKTLVDWFKKDATLEPPQSSKDSNTFILFIPSLNIVQYLNKLK